MTRQFPHVRMQPALLRNLPLDVPVVLCRDDGRLKYRYLSAVSIRRLEEAVHDIDQAGQ